MNGKPPPVPLKYHKAAAEQAAEPRRAPLPPPPKPQPNRRETIFRVVIVLVIFVSVTVAYWSFFHRLAPLQAQARSMITRVSGMSARLDQAERRWTPAQAEETRARYQGIYKQLFADPAALDEWLRQVHSEAKPLKLDLNVSFGKSVAQSGFSNNLAVIPASISLEVLPAPDESQVKSSYERVLLFGQQLAAHGKRADLAELTVSGGTSSISRAVLVFNLWAGDLGAEATATPSSSSKSK